METRECFGWPVAASTLTDLLLWIEDRLDLNEAAFIRLVGANEILSRLNGHRDLQGEDLVVYTASIAANLTSAFFEKDILAVSPGQVVRVLHEIAADSGVNTIVLKNEQFNDANESEPSTRLKKNNVIIDQLRDENDLNVVQGDIVRCRSELVISYAMPTLTKKLYDQLSRVWQKPLVVVQLPYASVPRSSARLDQRFVSARLHVKLALIAMSGNFSSESR